MTSLEIYMNALIQYTFFGVQLLPLSIMYVRFICAAVQGHGSFVGAASHSFVWLDHNALICYLLIVMWGYYPKNAAMNIDGDAHVCAVLLTLYIRMDSLWIRGTCDNKWEKRLF